MTPERLAEIEHFAGRPPEGLGWATCDELIAALRETWAKLENLRELPEALVSEIKRSEAFAAERDALKARVGALEEALGFYADPDNWLSLSFQCDIIRDRDVDEAPGHGKVGGRRARAALKEDE